MVAYFAGGLAACRLRRHRHSKGGHRLADVVSRDGRLVFESATGLESRATEPQYASSG